MKSRDKARPKPPPAERGAYMAVCAGAADLGETVQREMNGVTSVWKLAGEAIELAFAADTVNLSLRVPGAAVLAACPKGG